MAPNDAKLLDQKQLALMLGVKPKTVARWTQAGQLPKPVINGKRKYWSAQHIETWLASSRPESTLSGQ